MKNSGFFSKIRHNVSNSKLLLFYKGAGATIASLSLNIIGVLFLTFGLSSITVSVLLRYLHEYSSENISLFYSTASVFISIPMVLSKYSIADYLKKSSNGKIISEIIGIRQNSLKSSYNTGKIKYGFFIGLLFSFLSLLFTTKAVLLASVLALSALIIPSYPMFGLALIAFGIPLFGKYPFEIITVITLIAYILKVLMGKRTPIMILSVYLCLAVTLESAVSSLFSPQLKGINFIIVPFVFLLTVFSVQKTKDALRLLLTIVFSVGVCSAVCFTINILTDFSSFDYLIRTVSLFSSSQGNYLTVLAAASIPLSVGLVLTKDNLTPRFLVLICTIFNFGYLISEGSYNLLAISLVCVFVQLILWGRMFIYPVIASVMVLITSLVIFTDSGKRVFNYCTQRIIDVIDSSYAYMHNLSFASEEKMLFGHGFLHQAEKFNSYTYTIKSIGLLGFAFLTVFFVSILINLISVNIKIISEKRKNLKYSRFFGSYSGYDIRLSAATPFCSLLVLLIYGLYHNLWTSTALYLTVWFLSGLTVSTTFRINCEINKAERSRYGKLSANCAETSIFIK